MRNETFLNQLAKETSIEGSLSIKNQVSLSKTTMI